VTTQRVSETIKENDTSNNANVLKRLYAAVDLQDNEVAYLFKKGYTTQRVILQGYKRGGLNNLEDDNDLPNGSLQSLKTLCCTSNGNKIWKVC
jgi:hypothetical protein